MLLGDIIDKYINRPIKVGGSYGGFIFCGYIRDNYKELFNILNKLENQRSFSRIENITKEKNLLITQRNKMREKMVDGNLDTELLNDFDKETQNKLNAIESRLKKAYEEQIVDCDLLSMEVVNKYRSNVDGSIIFILNYNVFGKFVDRNECIAKEPYKSLVEKYNI